MPNPVDRQTRSRALHADRSYIVQAPAGSGKTELLVRRCLRMLAGVRHPEEVVAITFTRKAAAEMRERILAALEGGRSETLSTEVDQELWQLARAAWRNDQAHDWRLERHPARLRILTIDALCASLNRQMPWLSRCGAPVAVVEDAADLYREAALRSLRLLGDDVPEWSAPVSTLLVHLDNDLTWAVSLLTDMLSHRDQWLRHLGVGWDVGVTDWRDVLESAWGEIVHSELDGLQRSVPHGLRDELLVCARYAAQRLAESGAHSPIVVWRDRADMPDTGPGSLTAWCGLAELLLTRHNSRWRVRVDKSIGFPSAGSGDANVMRQRLKILLKGLAGNDHFRRRLARVRSLPAPCFTEAQWRILAAVTRVLPLAAAQLELVFAEQARVDFMEVSRRANLALGDLHDPSDLALRLDYRIQHLLLDEFQDTSLSQFELIESLTAGWEPGDGRTLFLVGDPLQSIYRFREAEVGLFLRVAERGLGSVRPELLKLSVNFRSDRSLVEWINGCFRGQFPAQSDPGSGAIAFSHSEPFVDAMPDAGVAVHPLIDAGPAEQAQRIIDIVRASWNRSPEASIAVLVRSRTQLRELLPALDAEGLDYLGVGVQRLVDQAVVQDLLSLTLALLYPADRAAWLAVLRAPWCGLTLVDLHTLVAEAPEACVWERMRSGDILGRLSADGRCRLTRIAAVLEVSLANRGRWDLRRWVADAWERLGGPACVDERALNDAEHYFDLLADHDGGGDLVDLPWFERVVRTAWTQSEAEAGARLQVMTVHKAKGLEFDTVIVPGLETVPQAEAKKLLLWEEQAVGSAHHLLLAPIGGTAPNPDPHYEYIRRLHADKGALETGRLLYVACTRARRRLHLVGVVRTDDSGALKPPPARSFLSRLWPTVRGQFETQAAAQLTLFRPRVDPGTERILRRLPGSWRPPVAATPAVTGPPPPAAAPGVEFSWVGESARLVGILLHQSLQDLAAVGLPPQPDEFVSAYRERWRRALIRNGSQPHELAPRLERLEEALRNVLDDPRARWLFDPEHSDCASERALSALIDGVVYDVRIDRLFVDRDGVRWIVDFKSGTHLGGSAAEFVDREVERYRPQLETYARIVQSTEQRPIRLGLYFPLLRTWREWAYHPDRRAR